MRRSRAAARDLGRPPVLDAPQYLLLNLAIGGSWGGTQGIDDAIFPAQYLIDYVRVYEQTP